MTGIAPKDADEFKKLFAKFLRKVANAEPCSGGFEDCKCISHKTVQKAQRLIDLLTPVTSPAQPNKTLFDYIREVDAQIAGELHPSKPPERIAMGTGANTATACENKTLNPPQIRFCPLCFSNPGPNVTLNSITHQQCYAPCLKDACAWYVDTEETLSNGIQLKACAITQISRIFHSKRS